MSYDFTDGALAVIRGARRLAVEREDAAVEPEHIFLSLAEHREALAGVTDRLGLDWTRAVGEVAGFVGAHRGIAPAAELPITEGAKRVLEGTLRAARAAGHPKVGLEHLLVGVVSEGASRPARAFAAQGISPERVTEAMVGNAQRGGGDGSA